MQLIYRLFEKGFLKYLLKKNGTKLTKDNLVFNFCDLDGNMYYSFSKEVELPIVRLGKLQEYYTWLSAGITGDELERMVDECDKALSNGLKDGKGLSKIGFFLSEIKDRKNMCIHPEIYYNMLAVQLIRHDEKVNDFNNDIHLQKVEAFKLLDKENDSFFLQTQQYLKALNLSNITREKLQEMFKESLVRIRAMHEVLKRESGK